LEQLAYLFLCQSDTGILYGKTDEAVIFGFFNHTGRNDYLTLLGKLDGVVGIIDQDLSHSQLVADKTIGSSFFDVENKLQHFGTRLLDFA